MNPKSTNEKARACAPNGITQPGVLADVFVHQFPVVKRRSEHMLNAFSLLYNT